LSIAKAMTMGYVYEFGDRSEEDMFAYDLLIEEMSLKFNQETN
jgi:hypothetical protein